MDTAYFMGGHAGLQASQFERAEVFYRALLSKHPGSRHVSRVRDELVTVLDAARKLNECVVHCLANLEAEPNAPAVERWRYMIGSCRFRLWEFRQAETDIRAFLRRYPGSHYSRSARGYLALINPPLRIDAKGVVGGYEGKYVEDIRFQRVLAELPTYIAEAWDVLESTLGVRFDGAPFVIEFRDKGFSPIQARAFAETISIEYKPVTRIVFYTEHVVVSEADFKKRLTHELKHAAFRDAMGQAYMNLPMWAREGLAVYGARQLDDRLAAVVGAHVFAGLDYKTAFKGIDNADRDASDYVEDACAFLWLENRKPGGTHEFCRRLMKGEAYSAAFAEVSGMEFRAAMDAAAAFASETLEKRMGEAGSEFLALRAEETAAEKQGKHRQWLQEHGIRGFRDWLAQNPEHLLAANCRYRLGAGLIATGEADRGRVLLEEVKARHQVDSVIIQEAQLQIARSYEAPGEGELATAAWGELLRDYSWSQPAMENRHRFQASGPVRDSSGEQSDD